jgi:SAM-dependent methyltransferase
MNIGPQPYGLLDYYLTSVTSGLRSLPSRHPRDAAARIVNPLSYPRFMEYQLAMRDMQKLDHGRVLDIGSPKLPVLLLARHARFELYATDVRDYFVDPTRLFISRAGLGHRLDRDLHLEVQDGRHLTYADAWFDWVYSISVFEHIPDDGDSQAIADVYRVLRPGGVATLTVPFRAVGYYEEFVKGDVYERRGTGGPTFYQRHYDMDALQRRLIGPSHMRLTGMTFFGEPGLQFEQYWNRIPMKWKIPLLWAQPLLAKLFLRELDSTRLDRACGVALRLEKARDGDAIGQ